MVISSLERRATGLLHRLADAVMDDESLRREALAALGRALPVDGWSWATADPASRRAVSVLADHPLAARMPRLLALEDDEKEINRRDVLAASGPAAAGLALSTRGRPERSIRWREHLHPSGIGDELRVVFADRTGCWGYLDLYTSGHRRYRDDEIELGARAARLLTPALRRGRGRAPLAESSPTPREPAIMLLDPELRVSARAGPTSGAPP